MILSQKAGIILVVDDERDHADGIVEALEKLYYTSRPRGSGLGLPTAKKIIAAHNGSIAVRSDLGKGTSFTIRLPLCSA